MGLMNQEIETQSSEDETINNGTSQETPEDQPNWWIEDGIPGVGERPEWLPEKYKTAKALSDAYKSLEQKLGQAPDKYDWESGKDWLDPDYEPFQEMAELARTNHVPQPVMDKMLESVGKYLKEFQNDYTEERQKLGENAGERLTQLENWVKANFTESSYVALTNSLKTAESIQALEELRDKMINNNTTIPTGNEQSNVTSESIEDIEHEIASNLDKYKTDNKYRSELQQRIAKVVNKSTN
jgi:gas vesicle protein